MTKFKQVAIKAKKELENVKQQVKNLPLEKVKGKIFQGILVNRFYYKKCRRAVQEKNICKKTFLPSTFVMVSVLVRPTMIMCVMTCTKIIIIKRTKRFMEEVNMVNVW